MRIGLIVILFVIAGTTPARADRLIRTPTGFTLRLGSFRAEAAHRANNDHNLFSAEIGLPARFEASVRHHNLRGGEDETEFGGQFAILHETTALPGVAVGGWDLFDDGPDGRRFFVVASKRIPFVETLPIGPRGLRIHLGAGTNRLSGVFGGAELEITRGLLVVAESDSQNINAGLHWEPIRYLRLKGEFWDGDLVLGVQLRRGL